MIDEAIVAKRERLGLGLIAAIFMLPIFLLGLILSFLMVSRVEIQPKKITIREGQGFIEISNMLADEQIIRKAALFRIFVLFRGWAVSLRPGTYSFEGKLSIPQVAKTIVSGPGDIEVIVPEGFTIFDIDKRLNDLGLIGAGQVVGLAQSPELFKFSFLQNDEVKTLEGFLFPDTYRFGQKMNAEAIVSKMLANFEKKVISAIGEDFGGNPSLYAVIILASLIEKEVLPAGEDRKIVADILWKRLELQIPLQVDAAVVYAWKQVNPNWKPKNFTLSAQEIKINSPYNTYRFGGLPPGPIANPGLDAIKSALAPLDSPYWYYLSTPQGETIFSKNLEEHARAKAKYLK